MAETVTISKRMYHDLLAESAHLSALESLGVDNWGGYVGYYVFCEECDAEHTWADEKCSECGEELPEPNDYI